MEPVEFELTNPRQTALPENCKKYYISDIAFTGGWINTFNVDDFEELNNAHSLGYVKVSEIEAYRGSAGVFIKGNSVIVLSSSGLLDMDNYIIFCNTNEDEVLEILTLILKRHIEKIGLEITREMLHQDENEEKVVINPIVEGVKNSRNAKERARVMLKMFDDFLSGKYLPRSVEDILTYVDSINRVYYGDDEHG